MTMWVCRAGRNGEYESAFLESSVIATLWDEITIDLTPYDTKDKIQDLIERSYPGSNPHKVSNWRTQLYSFRKGMKIGDNVLMPSKIKPGTIYIGKITSDYHYDPQSGDLCNVHNVKWNERTINRGDLDADIRNSIGAFLTIFQIRDEQGERVLNLLSKRSRPSTNKAADTESSDEEESSIDVESEAMDEITSKIIQKFKGHGMEKVIASILQAKGFTVLTSPAGPDRGIDVLAAGGVMGFGQPKICVQVKSTEAPVELATLVELQGSINDVGADYGLLVSWGGFKQSILNTEKRNKFFKIRLWDHNDIIREFLENYDKLDEDIRVDVPLKKIWVINDQEL